MSKDKAKTDNPLLGNMLFPKFRQIKPEHVEDAIDYILSVNRTNLASLLKSREFSWDNLVQPLEEDAVTLENAFSPVRHLNSVMNNDKLRKAYNNCLPKLSEYAAELGQNTALFKAFLQIKKSSQFGRLNQAQRKTIENALRDFKLSGVDLPASKKKRFKEISTKLSSLGAKFSENILDVTNIWFKHVTDKSQLKGLSENVLQLAAQTAKDKKLTGYVFNLEFPLWHPVMQYAENRELRREMYKAYVTRASGLGPHDKKYDNSKIMLDILKLKQEQAEILAFKSYAEVSLASKMAESPAKVIDFLTELFVKSKAQAKDEFRELKEFARQQRIDDIKAWDVAFLSEKLKTSKFNISSQELRDWFPADKVINGMFELCASLFSIKIDQVQDIEIWHKDVKVFRIQKDKKTLAYFYLDLYARANKRGGAWMDECRSRICFADDKLQLPIAYLSCNFSPPLTDQPSLLTFEEVTTLFHEFGHGLQHMLTTIEAAAVSGINGVQWDAVELPSQFLENFCWQSDIIPLISAHFKTGKPLPDKKLAALLKAKNFQSAMAMLRQLEFALFDMRLHNEFKNDPEQIENTLAQVRGKTSLLPTPKWNRFANSFSHIFAGGYAAGYYSYKWAEVLAADAFALFEEKGIFDKKTGKRFLTYILETGGSQDALDLFVKFRGRKPQPGALLRHSGIRP